MPDASDAELLAAYPVVGARQIAYGHIHRPFSRLAGGLRITNAGSVGLPWDGDPRAFHLLITDEMPEIVRVAYDVEAEVAALHAARHPDSERLIEMPARALHQTPTRITVKHRRRQSRPPTTPRSRT